eukprot:4171093-Lingulodinium_polyedra.AAC.1
MHLYANMKTLAPRIGCFQRTTVVAQTGAQVAALPKCPLKRGQFNRAVAGVYPIGKQALQICQTACHGGRREIRN